ncbi:MAG TPA: hypothetical protein VNK03_07945 [Gammaproteobacteria bacterium]|nr:hypothetical protein [Gammaproteobacteria bacterium]
MTREYEDLHKVVYKIEMDVPFEKYLSRSGKTRFRLRKKIGYFTFDKLTEDVVKILERSDPYFINNAEVLSRCTIKMYHCRKEGIFPENVVWAG